MKKLSTLLIIAFALVLGLSQCKKKVDTIATPSDLGKTVHITVNVGDGDRHIVYPGTGAVVYTDGDKIYVGDGKKYLGTLTYGSGAFSGDITEPAVDDYLYFYFLGGLTLDSPSAETTSYTVSIADQSSQLPVLSLGRSSSPYTTSSATYGCTLENKCALVKFILNSSTSSSVKVGGMKTEACIDFKTPGIIPTEKTGAITLNSESGTAKWAILLPIASETPTKVEIKAWNYNVIIPQIEINDYLTGENAINVPYSDYTFTIGGSWLSNTVRFSQGNLQYKEGEGWRFAQNQYDYINAWNTSDWVDRFGFGTWGEGRNPLNTSTDDYSGYQWSTDFKGSIGGYSDWRTLSRTEWVYLFNTRSTGNNINSTQNARYTKAAINTDGTSVNGIILFPDQSIGATPEGVTWGAINDGASAWGTKCTTAGWNALENAGCVFLPAAGGRDGTSIFNPGSQGQYWSSSVYNYTDGYYLNFNSDMVNPEYGYKLYFGRSVRLVH